MCFSRNAPEGSMDVGSLPFVPFLLMADDKYSSHLGPEEGSPSHLKPEDCLSLDYSE
jgi:hypothetical protein